MLNVARGGDHKLLSYSAGRTRTQFKFTIFSLCDYKNSGRGWFFAKITDNVAFSAMSYPFRSNTACFSSWTEEVLLVSYFFLRLKNKRYYEYQSAEIQISKWENLSKIFWIHYLVTWANSSTLPVPKILCYQWRLRFAGRFRMRKM